MSSKVCVFCKTADNDESRLGGLKRTRNLYAHHFCLLLSETINQSGQDTEGIMGFMVSDIKIELAKSRIKQCCYCKKYEATLQCKFRTCKKSFHLTCGLAKNTQHDFNTFTSFCHLHKNPSNVPESLKDTIMSSSCVICLENFGRKDDFNDLLWAECCKANTVMHIDCIQKLAVSAGYFTKCPTCNNSDVFVNLIKSFGIFVPERDASWELERNAFSDLYARYKKCTMDICKCPKGREFHGSGPLKIIMCDLCGTFGSHRKCSTFASTFTCTTCLNINNSTQPSSSNNDTKETKMECNENLDTMNIPSSSVETTVEDTVVHETVWSRLRHRKTGVKDTVVPEKAWSQLRHRKTKGICKRKTYKLNKKTACLVL